MIHAASKIGLGIFIARADDQIIFADTIRQFFNIARVVLSVRVKDNDEFARRMA